MSEELQQPLLPRVAAGEAGAVEAVLQRYSRTVYGLARRQCKNAQDAEDAAQDIFLEVWRSAGRFDPAAGSEMTFLMTIARRRVIDRARRMARRPVEQLLVESEQVVEPDAAAQAEIADDVGRAREALQQLRPEQREVLELSLAAGRTHQEISAAVGIPLGTVKSHARRGLLRLRELLGVDPGAADESR
jgi:RNA polymerase sigma-70 factor (ECF subfamily)